MNAIDGLSTGLGDLWRLPRAQSRSISPENFTGEKGKAGMATEGAGALCARDLGLGWKVSVYSRIGYVPYSSSASRMARKFSNSTYRVSPAPEARP